MDGGDLSGKGHPMLELVALPEFLAGKPYRALCTVNPYPGAVTSSAGKRASCAWAVTWI